MKPRTKRAHQSDIFAWSGKYHIGIAKLDKQHKKLVALINTLAKRLAEQADDAALMQVFDELASYTSYHFRTEEELMQEYRIDAAFESAHREAHAAFVQQIMKARTAAHDNPQEVSTRTLTFLSRWLIQHILGTDMRMANEMIALEKGFTPEEARARALAKMADTHEVLLQAMGELYESLAVRTQDFLLANRKLKEEIAFHRQAEEEINRSHARLQSALDEHQDQTQDIALLNEASELLQTCVTEAEACRAFGQMAEHLALGESGALALTGIDDPAFRTVAKWGNGVRMLDSFGGEQCWAIRRGQPHRIVEPARELVCTHFQRHIHAPYLCLPLIMPGNRVIGLIHVLAPADADHAKWLRLSQIGTALANMLKLALTNIHLTAAQVPRADRK
jgi:hemerythrin-like metal-binding protein